eukprot:gene24405-26192_t
MFSLRSIQMLVVTVVGLCWALGRADMFALPCADNCKLITTDSLIQCRCDGDAEVSSSCYLSFGWYDHAESPCQFASAKTDTFTVTFAWNNYKDCGGDTSDPCQYFNGTSLYSAFDSRPLTVPFAWSTYNFTAHTENNIYSLFAESSDRSGFGRLI